MIQAILVPIVSASGVQFLPGYKSAQFYLPSTAPILNTQKNPRPIRDEGFSSAVPPCLLKPASGRSWIALTGETRSRLKLAAEGPAPVHLGDLSFQTAGEFRHKRQFLLPQRSREALCRALTSLSRLAGGCLTTPAKVLAIKITYLNQIRHLRHSPIREQPNA